MKNRTSLLDILRLAIALARHPYRSHLRIGQLMSNATSRWLDIFYVENKDLIQYINEYK